jgi:hypothetical protein
VVSRVKRRDISGGKTRDFSREKRDIFPKKRDLVSAPAVTFIRQNSLPGGEYWTFRSWVAETVESIISVATQSASLDPD